MSSIGPIKKEDSIHAGRMRTFKIMYPIIFFFSIIINNITFRKWDKPIGDFVFRTVRKLSTRTLKEVKAPQ